MVKIIFSLPKISKDIKRLQDKGYPVKSVLDLISNDENTDTIVYTSPQFQPCSDTFSDKYVFVGPSIRPATEKIEKTRDKLVYISMGTVNNDMMPLYKSCIEAFRDSGFQVILSVGNMVSAQVFDTLPENISVFPYVDQIAVLNKADVFISHCGMNSASESLYFGVPLVMLPQTDEQRGVAERILQLGAGVKPDRADSGTIYDAVKTVLADSQYKENANKIAEDFRKCTGAKGAADKILSMI